MIVSVIVATSANKVIGKDNKLPWHLPADLQYFKNLTMGHHIIMGRKTYDSIGKPLPGRTSVIITRQKDYKAEGAVVTHSIEEALEIARRNGDTEAFVIGGAEIIHEFLPIVDKIYLTEIHAEFEGDTFLHLPESTEWKEVKRTDRKADEKNKYDFSFLELVRK
ncbi:MAG TPA: dihydrofolate reductase [Cytophagaceae bacterium]